MANKTLRYISTKMKHLDICMMSTLGSREELHTRPMSNNKDVKYKGESFFFSLSDTRKFKDIQREKSVTLSFSGEKGLCIIITGKARLIKSKPILQKHWVPSLKQWFSDGVDTSDLVLISVKAKVIKSWANYKEGNIDVE
ncbi:MAG: pyridoxamine 5'-phosphate oxidase family protein [Ferruginibacter sp.]